MNFNKQKNKKSQFETKPCNKVFISSQNRSFGVFKKFCSPLIHVNINKKNLLETNHKRLKLELEIFVLKQKVHF